MQTAPKRYASGRLNIMLCIKVGYLCKIVAYSGFLCSVCRKYAYFAKMFAGMRKLYYISPRKDETTTTKNENTMKKYTLKQFADFRECDRDGVMLVWNCKRWLYVSTVVDKRAPFGGNIALLYDLRTQKYKAVDLQNHKRADATILISGRDF